MACTNTISSCTFHYHDLMAATSSLRPPLHQLQLNLKPCIATKIPPDSSSPSNSISTKTTHSESIDLRLNL
ncbi:hypothetical protein MKW92_035784, partial [Papaver armeniacum]